MDGEGTATPPFSVHSHGNGRSSYHCNIQSRASIANRAATAAFDRIHELNNIMSDYDPQSELRRLSSSSSAGKGIKVSDNLWCVLEYAQTLSQRTDGELDISIGPVVRLWHRARMLKEMPSPEELNKALARTGYQSIRLDAENHSVELA